MKPELTRTLIEARTLAQERGWAGLESSLDGLLSSHPGNTLLMAAPAGIDLGGLPRWIAETVPSLEIGKAGVADLAADPLLAGTAERLMVVFECGKLMTADTVDTVTQICDRRPAGSFAIVLRGADILESESDLEMQERGVFRLLAPDPKPEWNGQDLQAYSCYLWSDSPPNAFLAARIMRDRNALSGWLKGPVSYTDALAAEAAIGALNATDDAISSSSSSEPALLAPSSERLYGVLNDLTELRRRLFARIDAEAPSVERQLTTSLQTLEQDLVQGLQAHLSPRLRGFDPGRDETRLKAAVSEYISAAATRWKSHAESVLIARGDEIQTDTDFILDSLDWTIVNTAAQQAGDPSEYPEALLENLAQSQAMGLIGGASAPATDTFHTDRRKAATVTVRNMVILAAIGQCSLLLGAGPVGLAAAGIGLIGQAAKYKEDAARLCEEYAKNAIQATFRDATQAVQAQTRENYKTVRSRLADRFRELEAMLDGSLQAARGGASIPPQQNPDRIAIAELRQRIASLATDASET